MWIVNIHPAVQLYQSTSKCSHPMSPGAGPWPKVHGRRIALSCAPRGKEVLDSWQTSLHCMGFQKTLKALASHFEEFPPGLWRWCAGRRLPTRHQELASTSEITWLGPDILEFLSCSSLMTMPSKIKNLLCVVMAGHFQAGMKSAYIYRGFNPFAKYHGHPSRSKLRNHKHVPQTNSWQLPGGHFTEAFCEVLGFSEGRTRCKGKRRMEGNPLPKKTEKVVLCRDQSCCTLYWNKGHVDFWADSTQQKLNWPLAKDVFPLKRSHVCLIFGHRFCFSKWMIYGPQISLQKNTISWGRMEEWYKPPWFYSFKVATSIPSVSLRIQTPTQSRINGLNPIPGIGL